MGDLRSTAETMAIPNPAYQPSYSKFKLLKLLKNFPQEERPMGTMEEISLVSEWSGTKGVPWRPWGCSSQGWDCREPSSVRSPAAVLWLWPHFNGSHTSHRLHLPMTMAGIQRQACSWEKQDVSGSNFGWTFLWPSVSDVSTQPCFSLSCVLHSGSDLHHGLVALLASLGSCPIFPPSLLLTGPGLTHILTEWNLSTVSLNSFCLSWIMGWQHNILIL